MNRLKEKLENFPKFSFQQQSLINCNVFVFDLNHLIDPVQIANTCLKYKIEANRAEGKQGQALYHTWRSKLFTAENAILEFSKLLEVCKDKANIVSQSFYSYHIHEYLFALYNQGDFAIPHIHSNVDLVGVYYARYPKNSSPLVFSSTEQDVIITPTEGSLIIFPGQCLHSVPTSGHEGDRIIVSFNMFKDKLLHKGDRVL